MGWSSLMCIILIVAGITFLMLGIIGEYVGKLIMTLNRSPLIVVRDTLNVEGEEKVQAGRHGEETRQEKMDESV